MSNNKEYRYFKTEDFACQETNANRISSAFVTRLDNLRDLCGFPFIITSGYRDPSHSAEVNKPEGSKGQHTAGIAADIRVRNAEQRFLIVKHAIALGFTGIGVAKTFVHVDTRATTPAVWSY